jgi:hypothetical protein
MNAKSNCLPPAVRVGGEVVPFLIVLEERLDDEQGRDREAQPDLERPHGRLLPDPCVKRLALGGTDRDREELERPPVRRHDQPVGNQTVPHVSEAGQPGHRVGRVCHPMKGTTFVYSRSPRLGSRQWASSR